MSSETLVKVAPKEKNVQNTGNSRKKSKKMSKKWSTRKKAFQQMLEVIVPAVLTSIRCKISKFVGALLPVKNKSSLLVCDQQMIDWQLVENDRKKVSVVHRVQVTRDFHACVFSRAIPNHTYVHCSTFSVISNYKKHKIV